MAKQLFNLKSLHQIGELDKAFEELRPMLVKDCVARPAIKKARELKIVMRFTPCERDPQDVIVETFVTCKMPNRPAEVYRMASTTQGGLKFQPDSPMSPDQDSLFEGDE